MNLQPVLDQRARVAAFQQKHRIGLLTLGFTDMVGSTQLKQELGDRDGIMVIQRHHELVREALVAFPEAEEIERAGDSFFLVFAKPSEAAKFALRLQARLRALSREAGRPVLDRVGIHLGEVFIEERGGSKDLYGLQVDACARVMGLAVGGQVLMTRAVFDNARLGLRGTETEGSLGLQPLQWLIHGPYQLKGVEEPLEICEVGETGLAPLAPPPDSEKAHRRAPAGAEPGSAVRQPAGPAAPAPSGLMVALLYKRHSQPDEQVLELLEQALRERGYRIFIDRHLAIGVEWAKEIERQVRSADAVVPLLSEASIQSEMLAYEMEIAHEAAQQQGKPRLLPVRLSYQGPLPETLARILGALQYALWEGPQHNDRLVAELARALEAPAAPLAPPPPAKLEPVGGAVPLASEFYVVRPTDEEFRDAIQRQDSIVLVKGSRQIGKTSLLARGLQLARQRGAQVVLTDFQMLSAAHLKAPDRFYLALAESLARQLDFDFDPETAWPPRGDPSINFERFLRRQVLGKTPGVVVWGLDEVDRLFTCDFGSEVFGLFRSWHNARALDPAGPWSRLTLAIAYATEAHLFITDMNQSPFNVGTRLALDDFTFDQVAELNRRYGTPLRTPDDVARFHRLVGGHPYLVRRGLHELATRQLGLAALEGAADRDEGCFGDHLRRILVLLVKDTQLCDIVRGLLRGRPCPTAESFYRLRSAGVMTGSSSQEVRFRCQLYAAYLDRHLL